MRRKCRPLRCHPSEREAPHYLLVLRREFRVSNPKVAPPNPPAPEPPAHRRALRGWPTAEQLPPPRLCPNRPRNHDDRYDEEIRNDERLSVRVLTPATITHRS